MAQLDAVERRAGLVSDYATGPERFSHLIEMLHDRAGQPVAVLVDEKDATRLMANSVQLYRLLEANDFHGLKTLF